MDIGRNFDFPLKEVIPGAGSLVEHIDKRIFVWLRDGRKYVGVLRSVDIFANLVLHNVYERIQIDDHFGDLTQGVIIVRGENVALLGEIEKDHGTEYLPDDLLAAQVARDTEKKNEDEWKVQAYFRHGMIFTPEDYF